MEERGNICRMIVMGDNRIMAAEISVRHATVFIITAYLRTVMIMQKV